MSAVSSTPSTPSNANSNVKIISSISSLSQSSKSLDNLKSSISSLESKNSSSNSETSIQASSIQALISSQAKIIEDSVVVSQNLAIPLPKYIPVEQNTNTFKPIKKETVKENIIIAQSSIIPIQKYEVQTEISKPAITIQPKVKQETQSVVTPPIIPSITQTLPDQTGIEINYNTQNPIQNVCKDGSLSHSTGRGACSHHGGIKR